LVVILDIGWGTVRTAKSVAEAHGLVLLGVAGDVERLPFRSGVLDGLVCDDTIEHLPNDQAGVHELARVLKRDGQAALATPNRHSAAVLRARLRDRMAGTHEEPSKYFVASSHLREYTWSEFERLIRPFFIIDRRRPVGWYAGRKKRLLSRFLCLPGLFRVSQMIVLQSHPRLDGSKVRTGCSEV
jgi:SAM-dependent methyltransferase